MHNNHVSFVCTVIQHNLLAISYVDSLQYECIYSGFASKIMSTLLSIGVYQQQLAEIFADWPGPI